MAAADLISSGSPAAAHGPGPVFLSCRPTLDGPRWTGLAGRPTPHLCLAGFPPRPGAGRQAQPASGPWGVWGQGGQPPGSWLHGLWPRADQPLSRSTRAGRRDNPALKAAPRLQAKQRAQQAAPPQPAASAFLFLDLSREGQEPRPSSGNVDTHAPRVPGARPCANPGQHHLTDVQCSNPKRW